jgi:hypothetical protein
LVENHQAFSEIHQLKWVCLCGDDNEIEAAVNNLDKALVLVALTHCQTVQKFENPCKNHIPVQVICTDTCDTVCKVHLVQCDWQ